MILAFLVACVSTLFIIYHIFYRRSSKTPPGPLGLPILGTLLSVLTKPHLTFLKWSREYGPILQTRIGFKKVLVLNEASLIREAFNDKVFNGRPDSWFLNFVANGKNGIASNDGQAWSDQRRFLLKNLREFGFGKQSMEGLIMDEVSEVIEWIEANVGIPISVRKRFAMSTINALWTIVTGKRFGHDDPRLNLMMENFANNFNTESFKTQLLIYFPRLCRLPLMSNLFRAESDATGNYLGNIVMDHATSPVDANSPRDFIDIYLNEIKQTKDVSSSFYGPAGRVSLRAVIGEIFGAGSGTTSSTLTWSILYLALHPRVQMKLQKEIDDCVGSTRKVSVTDKSKMPYTEAVMHEVLRFSTVGPLGLVHNTMENTTFHGYEIEKDTLVYANFYAVHFNEEIWGDPQKFHPERFLSPDEQTVTGKENSMAFSVGRRQCIGESLARDTFFLFLTNIFQKFKVEVDPENPNPSLEKVSVITEDARPFKVVFKSRK